MENKVIKKSKQHNLLIALWIIPFVIIELLLIFNLIFKVNKDNIFDFIFSIFLVAVIYIPGILISIKNKRNNAPKKSIWNFLFQAGLVFLAFVGLVEASFDSDLTVKQVKNFMSFIQGESNKVVYMESFEIKIKNEKDIYEIDDIIEFEITYKPINATLNKPLYEIDNDIVEIDIYNKTIKCLDNGTVNILFYASHNKEISYKINLTIKSLEVTNISFNEPSKDIFLNLGDTYQLTKPTILPTELSNEEIIYTSSKESVAVIDENGFVKTIDSGITKITCKAGNKTDEIYIIVDGFTTLTTQKESISVNPTYEYRSVLNLDIDNAGYVKKSYFSFEYDENLNLEIWYSTVNKVGKYVKIGICNHDDTIRTPITFTLTIKYTYPGGTEIKETVEVTLKPYADIKVSDIDMTKTVLEKEINIYKNNEGFITKYIYLPIYYKSIKQKNIYNYKFDADNINTEHSTYDSLIINVSELDLSTNNLTVKFYPSIEETSYLEFSITYHIIDSTTIYSGFEMNKLYETNEEKKNEIWYKYFTKDLFNDVLYKNTEYVNSGLIIEPTDETKEIIDIEISEYGLVTHLDFKEKSEVGVPKACKLEFNIYSIYEKEHNDEYTVYNYIIDIINDYDRINVLVDGFDPSYENFEITVKENQEISISYELQVDLEYKGTYQEISSNAMCSLISDDSSIAYVSGNTLYTYKPGITIIEVVISNLYETKLDPVIITVYVTDSNGHLPLVDNIIIDVESYDELSKPNLEEQYISTGTVLKLSMEYGKNYTFISSDNNILKIDEENTAESIKPGKVTIIAISNEDPTISYSYELTIYQKRVEFEILKGKFKSIEKDGNKYTIYLKTNNIYKINLSTYLDDLEYTFIKNTDSSNFELDSSGNILIKKDGTYSGTIILGEEDSPYSYKVKFTVISSDVGLKSTLLFFIRKAVGHFGLFLVTGIFAFMVLMIFNIFKIRNKILQILISLAFGPLLAYTTELIQKLTPSRTYSLDDVKLDSYGYLTGLLIVFIIYLIFIGIKYLINNKRNKTNE